MTLSNTDTKYQEQYELRQQVRAAVDGKYEESYDQFEKSVGKLPKNEVEKYLLERIMGFINKI